MTNEWDRIKAEYPQGVREAYEVVRITCSSPKLRLEDAYHIWACLAAALSKLERLSRKTEELEYTSQNAPQLVKELRKYSDDLDFEEIATLKAQMTRAIGRWDALKKRQDAVEEAVAGELKSLKQRKREEEVPEGTEQEV